MSGPDSYTAVRSSLFILQEVNALPTATEKSPFLFIEQKPKMVEGFRTLVQVDKKITLQRQALCPS